MYVHTYTNTCTLVHILIPASTVSPLESNVNTPEMPKINPRFICHKARGWSEGIKTAFPKNEKKKNYKIL